MIFVIPQFCSIPKLALWVTSTAHICCNHELLKEVFENLKICWTTLWSQCFRLRLCRKYGTAGRRMTRPQNLQESPWNYQINVICEHLRTQPELAIIYINTNFRSIQTKDKKKSWYWRTSKTLAPAPAMLENISLIFVLSILPSGQSDMNDCGHQHQHHWGQMEWIDIIIFIAVLVCCHSHFQTLLRILIISLHLYAL